ncbi:hypothetical protein LguiA_000491 [Lonicera macranthoides]
MESSKSPGVTEECSSNASSGPSYLATLRHGRTKNEVHGKRSSKKSPKQVEEKKLYNRKIKGEKQELGHKANKAAGCGYGGRKVRKPN